jgi:hypothetical protein
MPQDSGCKSLREHMAAMATCNVYIRRLPIMNFTGATATFISYRLHVLTAASALFLPSTN